MKKLFMLLAVTALLIGACEKVDVETKGMQNPEGTAQQSVESPATTLATTPGTVATIVIGESPFSVEIAETDEEKAKGLMNRESLAANSGMWFVFAGPVNEKFWMKDTLIPLDLIFVNNDMKVVHVIENAEPGSTEYLSSSAPYQYVLEVIGGTASKSGIKVGDAVKKQIGPQ